MKKKFWVIWVIGFLFGALIFIGITATFNSKIDITVIPFVRFLHLLGIPLSIGGIIYTNFGRGRERVYHTYSHATRAYTNTYRDDVPPMPFLGGLSMGYTVGAILTIIYVLLIA